MTEDSNINFNNIFNNSHNLTSLQPVLNNMGPLQPVTLEGKYSVKYFDGIMDTNCRYFF